MGRLDGLLLHDLQRPPPELQPGLAGAGMGYREIGEGDALADSGSQRLGGGLLGGEASGEKGGGIGLPAKLGGLGVAEYPLRKARRITPPYSTDAVDLNDVAANTRYWH